MIVSPLCNMHVEIPSSLFCTFSGLKMSVFCPNWIIELRCRRYDTHCTAITSNLTYQIFFGKSNSLTDPSQNKTNSAVQIVHKPTGIVVKSQATRSRSQNEKIAREILAEKVELLEKGDQSRLAIKREKERKRKASRAKKSRRKYRKLEEAKRKEQEEGEKSLAAENEGLKEEEEEEEEQQEEEQEKQKEERDPNPSPNQQQA